MKGQAGFEFYFSIMAFALVVIWVFLQLVRYYPAYFHQIDYEILKSEAWQLSEMLVNDPGEPTNWYLFLLSAKRIGLNDESKNQTNMISYEKAVVFNVTCNDNYDLMLKLLNTNYSLSVYLVDEDGNVLISCSHPHEGMFIANITRIVAIHSKGLSFTVGGTKITLVPEKTWWGELTLEVGK